MESSNQVKLTEIVFREGDMYVAYNPEFDVSSCDRTMKKSKSNLAEAISLFIEEAARQGTLENIINERLLLLGRS